MNHVECEAEIKRLTVAIDRLTAQVEAAKALLGRIRSEGWIIGAVLEDAIDAALAEDATPDPPGACAFKPKVTP